MDENKEKDTKAEETSAENIPEEISNVESEIGSKRARNFGR